SATVKTARNSTGYTMEIAIPWTVLGVTPAEGKKMGLLLGNNDRDNGVGKQFDWLGLINTGSYARPNLWGTIALGASLIVVPPADTTAPVFSVITANSITSSSATITWTTDEPADSQAEYGLTTSYGQSSALQSALVTSHGVPISGLSAGSLYHYRVKSRNAAGLLATSIDNTFTTVALLLISLRPFKLRENPLRHLREQTKYTSWQDFPRGPLIMSASNPKIPLLLPTSRFFPT
ncbi:MAG: Fibronectin, type III domain protein, partial [Candidatus Giovannonibacteria bacterium GW2011_GWB1_44_23]